MRHTIALTLVLTLAAAGCAREPSGQNLRDSFSAQLAANAAVKDLSRQGDDLSFTGPARDGDGTAEWRIHIDSAAVDPMDDARSPYKGTVKSSWFENGRQVLPSADGQRSNLPKALMSNGLAQDCWANWNPEAGRWEWE